MGAKKSTESQYEFLESSDALANQLDKAQSFVQSNNKLFLVIGGVLLVGILAFVGFHYYQDSRESEAQKALYKAIYDFEADSLNLALNGKGGMKGYLPLPTIMEAPMQGN